MATRTGVGRDLSPVKKGIKVGVGVWHCCASLELDRQNILLMDYITGLIVLEINITILLSSTVSAGRAWLPSATLLGPGNL